MNVDYNSTLQLFGAACRVYSPSDVRPVVELGDSLKQEGVVNPLPALMNPSKGKYTGQAAPKSCKVEYKAKVETLEKEEALRTEIVELYRENVERIVNSMVLF